MIEITKTPSAFVDFVCLKVVYIRLVQKSCQNIEYVNRTTL